MIYDIYKSHQRHFETAGNIASGTGHYSLATLCWAYAAEMKKRAQNVIRHWHGETECVVLHRDQKKNQKEG